MYDSPTSVAPSDAGPYRSGLKTDVPVAPAAPPKPTSLPSAPAQCAEPNGAAGGKTVDETQVVIKFGFDFNPVSLLVSDFVDQL